MICVYFIVFICKIGLEEKKIQFVFIYLHQRNNLNVVINYIKLNLFFINFTCKY